MPNPCAPRRYGGQIGPNSYNQVASFAQSLWTFLLLFILEPSLYFRSSDHLSESTTVTEALSNITFALGALDPTGVNWSELKLRSLSRPIDSATYLNSQASRKEQAKILVRSGLGRQSAESHLPLQATVLPSISHYPSSNKKGGYQFLLCENPCHILSDKIYLSLHSDHFH